MTRAHWLQLVLRKLRSGNPLEIEDAERMLIRESGIGSPATCRCPDFPQQRSAQCWAHGYIIRSCLKAADPKTTLFMDLLSPHVGRDPGAP